MLLLHFDATCIFGNEDADPGLADRAASLHAHRCNYAKMNVKMVREDSLLLPIKTGVEKGHQTRQRMN